MTRRHAIVGTITALAVATPALTAAAVPSITSVKLHRGDTGTWVLTANADYAGHARTASDTPGAPRRATLRARLTSGSRSITVTDSVRLGAAAHRGERVHFHVRIPAARARLLGSPERVRVRITLGRATTGAGAQEMAVQNGFWAPSIHSIRVRSRVQPPATPVAFAQVQGATNALLCVVFAGPGYTGPQLRSSTLTSLAFTVTDGLVNGDATIGGQVTALPPSGAFTTGSYYDTFVGGFAQVSAGPTLAGTIPPSTLEAPPSVLTGNATLTVSPAVAGFPASWALRALDDFQAQDDC